MLGIQRPSRKSGKDEAEKPFWISFTDLMTAMMVLFLVAMTVALLAITHEISEADKKKVQREDEISKLLNMISEATRDYPGVVVRGHSIDFGDKARFDTAKYNLSDKDASMLRSFVPKILAAVRDPLGKKWLKRVVVEGFSDQRGTYIKNLNLSLQRSERVLCVLMAVGKDIPDALSEADRLMIRDIFLVGGSSFNSLKESLDESRRVELKLEFLDIGEQRPASRDTPLDNDPRCPLD
ncbi:MAG: OmpA family protein [Deltaproteobacteria bacterium]|nr:OmpA family protein [Deltaproteobacteria bacterium]